MWRHIKNISDMQVLKLLLPFQENPGGWILPNKEMKIEPNQTKSNNHLNNKPRTPKQEWGKRSPGRLTSHSSLPGPEGVPDAILSALKQRQSLENWYELVIVCPGEQWGEVLSGDCVADIGLEEIGRRECPRRSTANLCVCKLHAGEDCVCVCFLMSSNVFKEFLLGGRV